MDPTTDLEEAWFDRGEALAESGEAETVEAPPPPNLLVRFGLALVVAGAGILALLGVTGIV